MGKVFYWELCKKFRFKHSDKWYTHKPESALKNETHKLHWNFEILMDHIISARRPGLLIVSIKREPAE